MPHGAPDWYKYRRDSITHPVDDLAELAVRLGSITISDRRGDVIFMDNFEHGLLHLILSTAGSGASVTPDPTTAKSGGYSAKMTTGDTANDSTQIELHMPYPTLSRFGLEVTFTSNNNLTRIAFGLFLHDGTTVHMAHVRYVPATDIFEFYNDAGGWTTFATGLDLYVDTQHFHTFKLVCDFTTQKYTRVILNDTAYDLSAYGYLTGADAKLACILPVIEIRTSVNSNQTIYLDNLIITQDEP